MLAELCFAVRRWRTPSAPVGAGSAARSLVAAAAVRSTNTPASAPPTSATRRVRRSARVAAAADNAIIRRPGWWPAGSRDQQSPAPLMTARRRVVSPVRSASLTCYALRRNANPLLVPRASPLPFPCFCRTNYAYSRRRVCASVRSPLLSIDQSPRRAASRSRDRRQTVPDRRSLRPPHGAAPASSTPPTTIARVAVSGTSAQRARVVHARSRAAAAGRWAGLLCGRRRLHWKFNGGPAL